LADKSAVIETIIPLEGNEKAVGFSLMSEARRAEMIRRAISTQTLAISKPIEFVQGDTGFLIAIPLYINNQLEVFLSTAVSQQVLINNAKQQFAAVFDTLDLSMSVEDQIIYKTKNFDIRMQDAQQHLKTSFVYFIGINEAKVDLISSPSFKQNQNIQFPEYYAALVFIVFFLMTHSLSLLVQFRHQTRLLSKALDDAKASEKAKDLFLSNMSHELRTPLNGIYGALQLLTGSNDTEKSLLVVAKHSTEALNTLVSDILDIQRLSEGNVQLTPAWHRPADIFRRVQHLHNIQARTKGLDLHIMLAEELPDEIYCDEVRLSQILNNIIGNAVKFTHEGFVKVEAHYNEHALRISISDTGIGMHHQLLEQIFERFSQADTSTTRQFGGTGLGMAITKELISLMHGNIAVQSLLGKGSSFTVTLPLEGRSSHSASEAQPPPTFSLRNLRVLLVDDVATYTLVGAAILRQHVGQVETASVSAKTTFSATNGSTMAPVGVVC
jgi:signal transduction histidine kinase